MLKMHVSLSPIIVYFVFFTYCLLFGFGCKKKCPPSLSETPYHLLIPEGFPEPTIPADNPLTVEKVTLGKLLFFDPVLSLDTSISCASCHDPSLAFTDQKPISTGFQDQIGFRNSPTLANIAYHDLIFKDGGAETLELQILTPLEAEEELNLPIVDLTERLNQHPDYPDLFMEAFGELPSPFTITRAIAAFERTLISGNSRFDQYFYQGDSTALSLVEKQGMDLFFSERTQCATCHSGFNFTNNGFENNGLYMDYQDEGRKRLTLSAEDIGKFKVPTLRNIAQTAPYMHDGSITDLEGVLAHYRTGGNQHPNKSPHIQPLDLTAFEQEAIIAFLRALTDSTFLNQ